MLLELTSDQEFFRETTARFLDEFATPARLRELRDDPVGYDAESWRRGAELGWTSLLVDEAHGGGSISGSGLADLALVAHEFGRHAAPGPLVATNVVAGALSAAGSHPEAIAGLLDGSTVATWCPGDSGRIGETTVEIRPEGDGLVISGSCRPVEAATSADLLLVTGRTGSGLTQVLVPTDAAGIEVRPLEGVDLTRRFGAVTFEEVVVPADAVVGEVGGAAAQVDRQLDQALVLLCAEAVGAMDVAFAMTLEWSFDRYSFGRPIASYQALKHRFAHMKSWLEASYAISGEATAAVAAGDAKGPIVASAAKAFIGQYGSELMHDCVQLHGGIGVTFEHDLHLYLRRHTVDRAVGGTPSEHRARIVERTEGVPA